MLKEKYLVFFVLLAVGINVSVLACLILMGIRLDARQHLRELLTGKA
jgi:heme exporter protein D